MEKENKQRPSLSVLLALKGLVPLEADCSDRIASELKDKIVIERCYQGNPDFVRRIELPPDCIKTYEYEVIPYKRSYSINKGQWVFKPEN